MSSQPVILLTHFLGLFCPLNVFLIVLGFDGTLTLAGHFVASHRERKKRNRKIVEEIKERDREERGTGMNVKKQKK